MSNSDDETSGPRIVSRKQDRREATPARAAAPGGAEPMSVSAHIYEVSNTPSGCHDYAVGDYIELYVTDPAPATVTVEMSGPCNGMTAILAD